jgi:hypothetical protein
LCTLDPSRGRLDDLSIRAAWSGGWIEEDLSMIVRFLLALLLIGVMLLERSLAGSAPSR